MWKLAFYWNSFSLCKWLKSSHIFEVDVCLCGTFILLICRHIYVNSNEKLMMWNQDVHLSALGPNTFNENETIAKYEIMDGAPVRGRGNYLLLHFFFLTSGWQLFSFYFEKYWFHVNFNLHTVYIVKHHIRATITVVIHLGQHILLAESHIYTCSDREKCFTCELSFNDR